MLLNAHPTTPHSFDHAMAALIAENHRLAATAQDLKEQNQDLKEENKKLKEDGADWKHDYEVTHAACKKIELELWRYDAIIKEKGREIVGLKYTIQRKGQTTMALLGRGPTEEDFPDPLSDAAFLAGPSPRV